ncbi:MAG: hypothetical protein MR936_05620 [Eubacterium sp.]|nr:hypothetical protein [Eubacterium sp.]MCI6996272.1 hypothetical protein [Eubacterium sp.]
MVSIIELMENEMNSPPEFPDEGIVSTLYYVSLVRNLRSMEQTSEDFKRGNQLDTAQEWLKIHSEKLSKVSTLNFDKITEYINPDFQSCDAFFYCFDGKYSSYLLEFKGTSKKNLLKYLKVNNANKDQILEKIKLSKEIIINNVEFSGSLEHEELIKTIHCVVIYDGKNDVPVSSSIGSSLPRKRRVDKDQRNHQNKASRQVKPEQFSKEETIERFANAIKGLGFSPVTKNEFPGNALPKVKKILGDKIRYATVMAAKDFAELVDDGYFDDWNWGDYQYFFDEKANKNTSDIASES